jgi:antibiotic biosynthesis monooxygenase (ABM) superfamily enzyme
LLVISRVWHGWTTPANAPAYERLLQTEILPGIAAKNLPGYHGAHLLRRDLDGEVEFVTILWFKSLDGVRALAGEDYEVAYVPPRARAVLSRFDAKSQHYDTLLTPTRDAVSP